MRISLPCLLIPDMLIGCMVHHQIHDKPHIPLVHLIKQADKIFHGAKLFHDLFIVADIISVIVIGGIINRGQPQCIHSQFFQVIQLT